MISLAQVLMLPLTTLPLPSMASISRVTTHGGQNTCWGWELLWSAQNSRWKIFPTTIFIPSLIRTTRKLWSCFWLRHKNWPHVPSVLPWDGQSSISFFWADTLFLFGGRPSFSYFFLDPFFPLILFRLSFESWILLHRRLLSPNLPPLRIPWRSPFLHWKWRDLKVSQLLTGFTFSLGPYSVRGNVLLMQCDGGEEKEWKV